MEYGFKAAANKIRISLSAIDQDRMNASAMTTELRNVEEAMWADCGQFKFLKVDPERALFIDKESLFGEDVAKAFPSAQADLKEAGNCLAAECNTAAVFHLMRAAEIALRALAVDRGVTYPHSSVDEQQCGVLITSLDSKLSALRRADKNIWPLESIKNEQIRFYHAATIELRSFNEAWRKQVCHAGSGSFYDNHQAASIFEHVMKFMQTLAPKISEYSTTPEYWQSI